MEALAAAVYNRWNNAGLNSSIAELYPAGNRKAGRNTFGPPPKTDLPRAEYAMSITPPSNKTRGSRYYVAGVTIQAWGTTDPMVKGWLATMRSALVNSEDAGTSPMVMTGGDIMEVDDGGSNAGKVDDGIFAAQLILFIKHRINNRTPA